MASAADVEAADARVVPSGVLTRWRSAMLAASVAGCLGDTTSRCVDGALCPASLVCAPSGGCVERAQLAACLEQPDGAPCTTPSLPDGVCQGGVCAVAGCGNGVLEAGEACDDGNRASADGCDGTCRSDETCGNGVADVALGEGCDCGVDGAALPSGCVDVNSDAAGAECRPDCQPARCGDGLVEGLEDCEGVDLAGAACTDVGYYGGELTCRPSCRFDTDACVGTCGDLEVNGPELCDGVSTQACYGYGFDVGRTGCGSLCGLDFAPCGRLLATADATLRWRLRGLWTDGEVGFGVGEHYELGITPHVELAWNPGDGWRTIQGLPVGNLDDFVAVGGAVVDHVYAAGSNVVAQVTPAGYQRLDVAGVAGRDWRAVDALADGTVFVGAATGEVLRIAGGSATTLRGPGPAVHALVAVADDDVTIGTEAGWAWFDGTSWYPIAGAAGLTLLRTPTGVLGGDADAMIFTLAAGVASPLVLGPAVPAALGRGVDGALLMAGANGQTYRHDGRWSGLLGVANGAVVALGQLGGRDVVADGLALRTIPATRLELALGSPSNATSLTRADDGVWAVGGGTLWRDGQVVADAPADVLELSGGGTTIYAMTPTAVWRRRDDVWVDVGPPATIGGAPIGELESIWSSGADDVAARTVTGDLLNFDGVAWARTDGVMSQGGGRLVGSGPDDVYTRSNAFGVIGVSRWDGATWDWFELPPDVPTEGSVELVPISPTEVYAGLGTSPRRWFRWDGAVWEPAWPDAPGAIVRGRTLDALGAVTDDGAAIHDALGWTRIRLRPELFLGSISEVLPAPGGVWLAAWFGLTWLRQP